ncbi:MAG TPA: hypothetical protein VGF90_05585 [Verrucomicrobiae bacterium]
MDEKEKENIMATKTAVKTMKKLTVIEVVTAANAGGRCSASRGGASQPVGFDLYGPRVIRRHVRGLAEKGGDMAAVEKRVSGQWVIARFRQRAGRRVVMARIFPTLKAAARAWQKCDPATGRW